MDECVQEEELNFNERRLQCVALLKQLRVQYPHLSAQVSAACVSRHLATNTLINSIGILYSYSY